MYFSITLHDVVLQNFDKASLFLKFSMCFFVCEESTLKLDLENFHCNMLKMSKSQKSLVIVYKWPREHLDCN